MKVNLSSNAIIQVECGEEEIKIKLNSDNFKVLSQEVVNILVGGEIKTKEGVAIVKDQHQQTDV